jgi:hypothetical protein
MLLRGYPSHEFVIDLLEASMLFRHVEKAEGDIALLIDMLGDDAIQPVDEDQGSDVIASFLNEEVSDDHEEQTAGEREGRGDEISELAAQRPADRGDSQTVSTEGLPRPIPGRREQSVHPGSGDQDNAGQGDEAA